MNYIRMIENESTGMVYLGCHRQHIIFGVPTVACRKAKIRMVHIHINEYNTCFFRFFCKCRHSIHRTFLPDNFH